jgi:hypothetical protein
MLKLVTVGAFTAVEPANTGPFKTSPSMLIVTPPNELPYVVHGTDVPVEQN